MSLIEKQKKLYNVKHKSDAYAGDSEPSKVLIKTEIEEDEAAAAGEDIFIDCATFIGSSDLKIESAEPAEARVKAIKRRKEAEVNNEEHQKLLDEFRIVLKKRKEKK